MSFDQRIYAAVLVISSFTQTIQEVMGPEPTTSSPTQSWKDAGYWCAIFSAINANCGLVGFGRTFIALLAMRLTIRRCCFGMIWWPDWRSSSRSLGSAAHGHYVLAHASELLAPRQHKQKPTSLYIVALCWCYQVGPLAVRRVDDQVGRLAVRRVDDQVGRSADRQVVHLAQLIWRQMAASKADSQVDVQTSITWLVAVISSKAHHPAGYLDRFSHWLFRK